MHWERVHAERDPSEVSWYEPVPETSLELIEHASPARGSAILDAGGGSTTVAGWLVEAGYSDVTVADISPAALERAREHLGDDAERVTWVEADLRTHRFERRFDLWHDRAVFHFMVDKADRDAYIETIRESLHPSGHLILATFGPQGPEQCSGLPVARYSADQIAALFAEDFALSASRLRTHRTPSGRTQQFLYVHLTRQSPFTSRSGRSRG